MEILYSIVDYLPVIVAAILTIASFFLTGKAKKRVEEILNEMIKYRGADYRQDGKVTEAQSFNSKKPVYKVDKKTNTLVDTGEVVDIAEIIQSCAETAMTKVLAKFLPQEEEVVKDDWLGYSDDLDYLTEQLTELDRMKADYGLDHNMSLGEVQQWLFEKVKKTTKKEVKKDESETIEKESEQA